jgi:tetratricopeptide (TPR) repeat protein
MAVAFESTPRDLNSAEDKNEVSGAERSPENEQSAIAQAWLANSRKDWPAALDRWEAFRERFPDNPWGYLGGIQALRGVGRADEIAVLLPPMEAAVAAARRRGLDEAAASALDLEIGKARLDWAAVRRACESLISMATAGKDAASPQVFLSLAQACWHLDDRDEADQAATRALADDPALSEAVIVRAWVATERGDGEAALSCYRRLVELNPRAVRWALKVIQLLNRLGRVKEALSELEIVRERWPADPMVSVFLQNYGPAAAADSGSDSTDSRFAEGDAGRPEEDELRLVVQRAPDPAKHRRALIVPDGGRDVLVGRVADSETAVFVFTGSNDAVSMPLPIFDRYLATLDTTAVYLKDFNRLRFLTGIQSLSENYPGTLAALREMLSGLGIKRLSTLGNCDGGFAAIRYGVELGAERIITFGAPTHSPREAATKIEQARNFMKNRLAAKVGAEMMDLRPFLEQRTHTSRIELFYEEEDDRDRIQALHLEGLPGVSLHPQPGLSNHYLLRKLALSREDFCGILEDLLGTEDRSTVKTSSR